MIVVTELYDEYIEYVSDGRKAREKTDDGRVVSFDVALLQLLRSLVHPESGWLTQSPHLAARLVPIAVADGSGMLVDQDRVDWIRAHWAEACQEAFDAYDNLARDARSKLEDKDRLDPILPILESPNPLRAFDLGADGLRAEIARLDPRSIGYHIAVRDLVAWLILSQRGLRAKNLGQLTIREDGRGNLRRAESIWRLWIPRAAFKNKNGGYFFDRDAPRDYDVALIDQAGLYQALELYLTVSRPALLHGRTSDKLFIAKGGADLGKEGLTQAMAQIYRTHLMYNPATKLGYKGLGRVSGSHWARAVLATGVLLWKDSLELAADAIHDTVETVKAHYARFSPRARAAALDDVLRDARRPRPLAKPQAADGE